MIIYKSNAAQFMNNVDNNVIVEKIEKQYVEKLGHKEAANERRSWNNSMQFMETIVRRSGVPGDCGILIEYNIPSTSKRIDFVISGHDEKQSSNFVIIELKQWEKAEATDKDAIVETLLNGSICETTHPAYQAYSYKKFLNDMNASIYEGDIKAVSCAYLHNYEKQDPEPLLSEQYQEIIDDTPLFFSSDAKKLEAFVKKYVGKGKGMDILYEIEHGRIKPSKKLVDCVAEMFDGNPAYTLLDEQKVAYENIIDIARSASEKTAIVIYGGPGTGKSVVAMNAFVTLLKDDLNIRFVAPNASFKESIIYNLTVNSSRYNKDRAEKLFSGSGSYYQSKNNEFDVLICDEAHRLKKKGAYQYRGESQVEDLVRAARVSVFFIDDKQSVRPDDEGSEERIRLACEKYGAKFSSVELKAQFRCSGAEGYMNWVDNTLQLAETANFDGWDEGAYDFRIFDDPNELYKAICERNDEGYDARMLAGFAWPWTYAKDGNKDAEVPDVVMPEYHFAMPWNSRTDQYSWAHDKSKRDQIGCIHTCQGLEFDYVGVIIGNDLRYDPTTNAVYASITDYHDKKGKQGLKNDESTLTQYIKQIYRVLLTRGMKGCYVFCRDVSLRDYLINRSTVRGSRSGR